MIKGTKFNRDFVDFKCQLYALHRRAPHGSSHTAALPAVEQAQLVSEPETGGCDCPETIKLFLLTDFFVYIKIF